MLEKNPIGIRNGCLRADWREAFDAAKGAGAECLELSVPEDYEGHPIYGEEGRKELKTRQEQSGIPVISICLGAFWKHSPSHPDAAVRQRAAKLLTDTVTACEALGVPYILAPLTHHEGSSVEAQRSGWREVLGQVAPRLAGSQVRLGLELCARDFAHAAQDALDLLDASQAPSNMGVYFDTANGMGRGHLPQKDIPLLAQAKRLTIVHIKDTKSHHLGEGDVDFAAVKKALEEARYGGPFVLETPSGDEPNASARRNLDFTKKLFRE